MEMKPIETEDVGPWTAWVYYLLRDDHDDSERFFAHVECAERARLPGETLIRWSRSSGAEEVLS